MRNYELTCIFSGELGAEQLMAALENVAASLQEQGAILQSQDLKGRRALPSAIKKQKEGNLAVVKFSLDPEKLPAAEKVLKADANILRFALLLWVPRKAKSFQTPHLASPSLAPAAAPTELTPTEKVELGEIDKKLEEIFKQPS